jgi:hypothetical protein
VVYCGSAGYFFHTSTHTGSRLGSVSCELNLRSLALLGENVNTVSLARTRRCVNQWSRDSGCVFASSGDHVGGTIYADRPDFGLSRIMSRRLFSSTDLQVLSFCERNTLASRSGVPAWLTTPLRRLAVPVLQNSWSVSPMY